MKQYYAVKAVHPDAILLFRVGDFYETFGDDAIKASGILGITLTRRANGAATFVELAGFPYHAIDTYLPKLVRAGRARGDLRTARGPQTGRKGSSSGASSSWLRRAWCWETIFWPTRKTPIWRRSTSAGKNTGVAFLDISTGEFYAAEGSDAYIDKLISNLAPKEIIYQRGYEDRFSDAFGSRSTIPIGSTSGSFRSRSTATSSASSSALSRSRASASNSSAAAFRRPGPFSTTSNSPNIKNTAHISSISRIDQDDYVWVDKFTIRNLELFSSNGSREKCAFADVVDRTLTPMGGRLLKRWIALPIKEIDRINERLDVVQRFYDEPDLAESVAEQISQVGDLERIASRIAAARVTPREIVQLKNSLSAIELLKAVVGIDRRRASSRVGRTDRPAGGGSRSASPARSTPTRRTIRFSRAALSPTAWIAELDDLRRIALHGKDFLQPYSAARERGDGNSVAQNQLQQCLRLLYRGPQHTQGQGSRVRGSASRRWPMPSDISPKS